LGLSVAQSLIEAQGGRIWAESELGRGSTFHFSVPVA
jgi:signal transduction histidine kinase